MFFHNKDTSGGAHSREPTVPHEIKWTRDGSARLWDYYAANKSYAKDYFSLQVGDNILNYARRRGVKFGGRVLDYGCGPGHLLEKLLNRKVSCEGVDFSEDSIKSVNERLSSNVLFMGASLIRDSTTTYEDNTFDVVFLTAVIEHLIDSDIGHTMAEIRRILKGGGIVIITTLDNEDLDASKVICPDCGLIFHRTQHVRTFTKNSLTKDMEYYGFQTIDCSSTTLRTKSYLNLARNVYAKIVRSGQPHLIYIGRKK